MSLFGSHNDCNLFLSLNREMINDIMDIQVDIYKVNLISTKSNVYDESITNVYNSPVRMNCIIQKDEQNSNYDEFGYNRNQSIRFSFLRDDLILKELYIDIGDIIHWNNIYWELDHIIENQLYAGKRPDTNKTIGDRWGWDLSIIGVGHMTNRSKINLEQTRSGNNETYSE
jgi:hypothetical protein